MQKQEFCFGFLIAGCALLFFYLSFHFVDRFQTVNVVNSAPKYLDVHSTNNVGHATATDALNNTEKLSIYVQQNTTSEAGFYIPSSIQHGQPKQYNPPPAAELHTTGKMINVDDTILAMLNMPETNFSVLNEETVKDFVFVIGCSSNHFEESKDAIATVQKYMPGYKILYYDFLSVYFIIIIGMQRLTKLKHHIVGNINHIVDWA